MLPRRVAGDSPEHAALLAYAASVRADRAANPGVAGQGTALELLLAPRFQTLVERLLPLRMALPPRVLPEYRKPGLGRPDLAFARPGEPARSFLELKEPGTALDPRRLRGHDADQFRRFSDLPLWGFCNFHTLRLLRRDALLEEVVLLPAAALDPTTPQATADRLIRRQATAPVLDILEQLALATPPPMRSAADVAAALAHAARLSRGIILDARGALPAALRDVRREFEETLFAHAAAGGFDSGDADALFAGAFAQTLAFGLLLAHEARRGDVDRNAYQHLGAETFGLLRATLRALTQDEILDLLGVGFDVLLGTVNAVAPDVLAERKGRDPILYFYEDFLAVFDPEARQRYGVFYTPVPLVDFIVASTDRALRDGLGCEGLTDPNVLLLDPACGTGTFAVGALKSVARRVAATDGEGGVAAAVAGLGQRLHGFELLIGPYTVAHWRVAQEIAAQGGPAAQRLPIYLADTLAPASGTPRAPVALGFLAQPLVEERRLADAVKTTQPILAILGNPPYRRLRGREVDTLVGGWMNGLWEDLKRPVKDAGAGLSLNAFPDLYVAFWRWALWRLFDQPGAERRGTISFVTNRGFLAGRAFGGLRRMLRARFDRIDILDLRGDRRGARPAGVPRDENVFAIETGVCVLTAWATGGERALGAEARVRYADIWDVPAHGREAKLAALSAAAADPESLPWRSLTGAGMDLLKPPGFAAQDWPAVPELFGFRSNGIVTYRDEFAYATRRDVLAKRIVGFLAMNPTDAVKAFKNTRDRSAAVALTTVFDDAAIEQVSYRPLDRRWVYNRREFIDFPKRALQNAWGSDNVALFVLEDGTGEGPAVWCHGCKPDQHAFRGSYGGWVFPLRQHAAGPAGHYVAPALLSGLGLAYGTPPAASAVFDAILALLSAPSYAFRFARDLEDAFPHVPFPIRPESFAQAAAIGAEIRALETFARAPAEPFRTARLLGRATGTALAVPPPARAFLPDGTGDGAVPLQADGSLRVVGVPAPVFGFAVSGYPVLHRWLKAREGEPLDDALLRGALDLVWRLTELLHHMRAADPVLAEACAHGLTRADLGLPRPVPFGAGAIPSPDE